MPRRLLIDCSLIDFSRQVTGIPRVVKKYLEEGYIWGEANGYQVVPVMPASDGIWIVRPLPTWLSSLHKKSLKSYVGSEKQSDRMAYILNSPAKGDFGPKISTRPGDILFCPAYWHDVDPEIYVRASESGALIATLVHDLLPILFENCYQTPWRHHFKANAIASIEYSDVILTVSQYTLHAVKELAGRSRKTIQEAAVAYNGFEPLTNLDLDSIQTYLGNKRLAKVLAGSDQPLLMVGSIEPKKAHIPVIQTLEVLWDAEYKRDLIIIGRRGWMDDEIVSVINSSRHYNSKLFWFDNLDDTDLALCYSRCRALLFTSLGEGFGIPMIEAATYRKPIIVYDTEIAREVLGHKGLFFLSGREFIDSLIEIDDPRRYKYHSELLESFYWPTWNELAPKVFDRLHIASLKKNGENSDES